MEKTPSLRAVGAAVMSGPKHRETAKPVPQRAKKVKKKPGK
jgi:hypothetical protein